MSVTPIADYAVLRLPLDGHRRPSRLRRVAVLAAPGWSVAFARMLDADAGQLIAPVGAITVERRYVERTMVLETTFTTPTGTLVLTDALSTGPGERGHQLGYRLARPHLAVSEGATTCTWSSHRFPSTGSSHRWPGR